MRSSLPWGPPLVTDRVRSETSSLLILDELLFWNHLRHRKQLQRTVSSPDFPLLTLYVTWYIRQNLGTTLAALLLTTLHT